MGTGDRKKRLFWWGLIILGLFANPNPQQKQMPSKNVEKKKKLLKKGKNFSRPNRKKKKKHPLPGGGG